MRTIKIVADSAANVTSLETADFSFAPLSVRTMDREFVDDINLDIEGMQTYFDTYKGKSQTSCPNVSDWLEAFGEADDIFCVTITSGLSGSYNAACLAKEIYESSHPDKRVWVLDSLSAGPEMTLIVDRLKQCVQEGLTAAEIVPVITEYMQSTGLICMLESLKNFAANGRVPMAVAKVAGVLGIRVIGRASDKGQLQPLHKCRGEKNALSALIDELKSGGVSEGKVHIAHCCNTQGAESLGHLVQQHFPNATVTVSHLRGLCSYYAEKGGILVGYEKK